jgi:chaperone modulatory protein CbpM
MSGSREFLLRARVDAASLEAWIEAGWLLPERAGPERAFSELDLARARLIRDLREGMGVNDEGVAVALDLLDQVHGLRRALRRLGSALEELPGPLRREILARLRGGCEEVVARRTGEGPRPGVG